MIDVSFISQLRLVVYLPLVIVVSSFVWVLRHQYASVTVFLASDLLLRYRCVG